MNHYILGFCSTDFGLKNKIFLKFNVTLSREISIKLVIMSVCHFSIQRHKFWKAILHRRVY